jgi:GntR family transcriptional regulator/MocR family aminotransferase
MDLHLDLATDSKGSLRARMEQALREAVRSGRLAPGTRLPSTRALCAELGVSRGVVADAYAQLAAEGYLQTRRGGGTIVSAAVEGAHSPLPSAARGQPPRYDMSPFRPALSRFPRKTWTAAFARVLRTVPDERLGYCDPGGVPELNSALAAYLGRVRGVRSEPDQVILANGLRAAMSLLWPILVERGARLLAVEQPGWRGVRETAQAAGLEIMPVPVDRNGLDLASLSQAKVDAVALAPAHQYPTGAVLAPARRASLLSWARSNDALIIEDDYDAEYRYDRQPIGSLQGLAPDHVVYGGSTSKTLAPSVGLGWLVLPRGLLSAVVKRRHILGAMPSPLQQLTFAEIIQSGELDRHLRRQRRYYQRQREVLLTALARELPDAVVHGAAAGLYLVLHLPAEHDEQRVLTAARRRGIALEGLGDSTPALVVGYANLTEASIAPAVRTLAESIRAATVARGARL